MSTANISEMLVDPADPNHALYQAVIITSTSKDIPVYPLDEWLPPHYSIDTLKQTAADLGTVDIKKADVLTQGANGNIPDVVMTSLSSYASYFGARIVVLYRYVMVFISESFICLSVQAHLQRELLK